MLNQFICQKCQAIVEVPAFVVLSPVQKAALAASLCRDCFGKGREVKSL